MTQERCHRTRLAAAIAGLALLTGTAMAQVDIADKPLFVTAGVEPNLITAIDDSGSMDSELLVPTNDGALWWHTGSNFRSFIGLDGNDSVAEATLNYNRVGTANGTWKKNIYLFPNGTGNGNRVYSDGSNDHYAIPPFPQFAFTRSAAYNGMYYDPAVVYEPWPSAGGFTFGDVDPEKAPSDPTQGNSTFNLTVDRSDTGNNWRFRVFQDMVIPEGTRYYDSSWQTATSDQVETAGARSIGVEYFPATYYMPVRGGVSYTVENNLGNPVTGSCGSPNPAHYELFERFPSTFDAEGVDALAYDGVCLEKFEIRGDNTYPSGRSTADELQNFANWFSYARKRHLATRSGIGQSFSTLSGVRTGALTLNSRTLRGMYFMGDPDDRSDFFNYIYNRGGNGGGTPNREAVKFIGDQFHANNSVITQSCQQNFALLFTDGFSNVWTGSGSGNADGDLGPPFADSFSNTMADIAARYYKLKLRGNAFEAGRVPVPTICASNNPPASADCNADLHMVTYGITLGGQGDIFGVTHNSVEDAHINPPQWVEPSQTRNPVQVDDLYHAAVNSRGDMLNARTADELREVLGNALLDIVDRTATSGTSSSTSAAILQADTLLYSVAFRSDDWSGDVIAQSIETSDGSVDALEWSAETLLANRTAENRNLLTWDGGAGITFSAANLSATQRDALNRDAEGVVDDLAEDRVDWMYGKPVTGLRSRLGVGGQRLLGDIVNSTPLYVGKENRGYSLLPAEFSPGGYGAFRTSIQERDELLVVGANDGMLHAFNAKTGEEVFAYLPTEVLEPVPGETFSAVSQLTERNYEHRYTVDGTPAASDVLINGAWRTVVVGTMGVGGRTVFAIDITDPDNISSSNVLWEFTDPDIGYGVTDPEIVAMGDGRFAAVFGNGYNSDSNRAMLFIVDVADGTLIAKVDTGAGSGATPNGLGPVATSDWPENSLVTQFVYAGDLLGNLWRFDVTGTDSSKWDSGALDLFKAVDPDGRPQPITVQPRVSLNPTRAGELIINFGTGSFFRNQDNTLTDPQVQTLYGVRDDGGNKSLGTRDKMLEQTIESQQTALALGEVRIVREISRNLYSETGQAQVGWFLDLEYAGNNEGERVISRVTFPSGSPRERVRFTSMTPSNDPCSAGRVGFIFDLDIATGGATEESVFDINDDQFFNVQDLIDGKMINAISGGRGEELTVIRNQAGSGDFFYDGAGQRIGNTGGAEGRASGDPLGRQSWQQLR
ncbi:pilus assembly protein [Chromatocurvus halotolerans]|uniref:Type IV pilus assembly protein PilY1 n=1 Tax=Chromatocurvus halotolerans TaxID=1132028 RepID=A0A4R2LAL2_9GAMM|nr:PilC/PilY family type IV pilus protein [Chromatocurvus halotolerans]TCO76305.1 type IV pilus assembly protein PilY1 [Chromatocurvus halotolerans]